MDKTMNFRQFLQENSLLTETWHNFFTEDQKLKYVDQVWDVLQQSYESIGGIHGSGFRSKQDMIDNIPFWKINTKNGKVVFVVMYKDKGGQKSVAIGTDGSIRGKHLLVKFFKEELTLNRGYGEMSGPLLGFLINEIPDLLISKIVSKNDVQNILGVNVDEPKELNSFIARMQSKGMPESVTNKFAECFYSREIGGVSHDKILFGTKTGHL